ncbi:CAMK/CAMKL/KIN1 protein kinase [Gaeumannomyces tritici R3-111a-1]|uniref:non-specific serine/threonine protein kinase n=1 Tax=Gaeumannomyces tritici (strain R3-111a-1) TaxID=644352 RepID=J3NFM1_GAET3|nr:CAMK/CAMKL/KIN1 protein kinase [Gaeumannomyces tritici R3-111a-1]EJT80061.1 CAMK/CAMKL/KIN1 protein kinase [Gaeumannomyces tritici R3-111a-1]
MTTAVSGSVVEPPHPASPGERAHAYPSVSRSQSTRTARPSTAQQAHRAASHSHSHNHSASMSSRPSSSTRPVQDVLPQHDYETTNVAQKRSSSNDRHQPSSARAESGTRHHHRTPSQRSAANGTADMPPPPSSDQRSRKPRTIIPAQSGKWSLGKTIGAGSMGKVKLARKEDGSEQVACKIIPRVTPDDGHTPRAERERADLSKEVRTAREAAIVTLLSHPHICGLRDVVRTNYHWYMLFEYVNGGQMLDYIISHGKLKEKQARKFSRQIASALDYCHRNSIVHRDLKIENILISKTGDIKIIDFGLSNLFSPRNHLKTFCGSLYFAAPELLQARPYQGPEVDVWSFGIVLYVLVCGKVPFDDQNMPALHAKIKKGIVDYPNWLSTECRHLLSRMLVTDPKQRATMAEVMSHAWMTKGYSGAPENYLPHREPLTLPLDQEVVNGMTGFSFGPPEVIKAQLTRIIESEDYQRSVRVLAREKEMQQPPREQEKKRGFGFYRRRNSFSSKDTLTTPSSEGLQLGNDPLNAFNPLVSVYYLVRERQERNSLDRRTVVSSAPKKDQVPEIVPPQEAHTNSSAYEMPGEKATGGRTRPRARTHGEDDAPESVKAAQPSLTTAIPPESRLEPPKKESTAAGLLRRFSTRRKKDYERPEKDRSHPPVVQVHSPVVQVYSPGESPSSSGMRKSFSIRRGRREREDHASDSQTLRAGSSQPQHSDLLSPPLSAGANVTGFRKGLGRSASVNSGEFGRRRAMGSRSKDPPPTSGSDHSTIHEKPQAEQQSNQLQASGQQNNMAMRAKSLGHARRESIQARRQRREAERGREANVPEETDAEVNGAGDGGSEERVTDFDLDKPVYLKGLFSVSTTSGKPVREIRNEIKRVLRQLGVDYTEIKGGFNCRHSPSIDLEKVSMDLPTSPAAQTPGGTHRRRFSFGLRGSDNREDVRDALERVPPTPRTPGRGGHGSHQRSDSSSEISDDSEAVRADNGESSSRKMVSQPAGETRTHVRSDMGGNLVLEFEIFIVKVPMISLHGIQFKRLSGNTWPYKNMADQILKELKL